MGGHSRWRAPALGLVVLALMSSMFVTARPRESLTGAERVARDVMAPVEGMLAAATHRVRETVRLIGGWRNLYEENERLRKEVAALRARNQALEEAWRENRFLRGALSLMGDSEYRFLVARVIGRAPENWWRHVTINRGRRDGVRPRMPVVTDEGVVGYVLSVSEKTAEVVLLADPRSAVGAVVHRTSVPVVVEGSEERDGRLRLRALVADADLRVGDRVVTSPLSQIFPSGLVVGDIDEVSPPSPGRAREAWVVPAVDLGRLEIVAVLLSDAEGVAEDKTAEGVEDGRSEDRRP